MKISQQPAGLLFAAPLLIGAYSPKGLTYSPAGISTFRNLSGPNGTQTSQGSGVQDKEAEALRQRLGNGEPLALADSAIYARKAEHGEDYHAYVSLCDYLIYLGLVTPRSPFYKQFLVVQSFYGGCNASFEASSHQHEGEDIKRAVHDKDARRIAAQNEDLFVKWIEDEIGIGPLLEQLASSDAKVAQNAASVLSLIPNYLRETLFEHLTDENAQVRSWVSLILAQSNLEGAKQLAKVLDPQKPLDSKEKVIVMETFSRWCKGTYEDAMPLIRETIPQIITFLDDKDANVREAAAKALCEFREMLCWGYPYRNLEDVKPDELMPKDLFLRALNHPDVVVRSWAKKALVTFER